jgi:hypothetical protein
VGGCGIDTNVKEPQYQLHLAEGTNVTVGMLTHTCEVLGSYSGRCFPCFSSVPR